MKYTIETLSPSLGFPGKRIAKVGDTLVFEGETTVYAYINEVDQANKFATVEVFDNTHFPITGDEVKRLLIGRQVTLATFDGKKGTAELEINDVVEEVTETIGKASKNYNALKNQIVSAGILSDTEVDERIAYMESLRIPFDKTIIKMVLEWILKNGPKTGVVKPATLFIDNYKDVDEYKNMTVVELISISILNHVPVVLDGVKSSGKSVCARTLAWLFNLGLEKQQFFASMTAEDIVGYLATKETPLTAFDKKVAFRVLCGVATDEEKAEYQYAKDNSMAIQLEKKDTPCTRAVRDGKFWLADEIAYATPDALGVLNGLLDGSPTFEGVNVNEGFVFVGTMNSGDGYTAVNSFDASFASRLENYHFGYPKSIVDILKASVKEETRKKLDPIYFEQADKFYQKIIGLNSMGSISDEALNVRGLTRALDQVASTKMPSGKTRVTLKDKIISCVIKSLQADKEQIPFLTSELSKVVNM